MDDFETFARDQIARLRAEADANEKLLKAYSATKARASGAARRSGGDQPRAGAFGAVMEAIRAAGVEGLNLDQMIAAADAEGYAVKRNTLRSQIWGAKEAGDLTQIEPGRYRSSLPEGFEGVLVDDDENITLVGALAAPTGPLESFTADPDDEIPF